MAENGMDKAIRRSSSPQRLSNRIWSARNWEPTDRTTAKMAAIEREIISPVRKNSFLWDRLAAMHREMAVWMEPAQRAKQMP